MSKDYSVSDTQWSKSSTAAAEIRTTSKVTHLKVTPFNASIEILKDTSSPVFY